MMTDMPDVATLVGALRNVLIGGGDVITAINNMLFYQPALPVSQLVDKEEWARLNTALNAARALVEQADRAAHDILRRSNPEASE